MTARAESEMQEQNVCMRARHGKRQDREITVFSAV